MFDVHRTLQRTFSDVFRTTAGEFARVTGYDRSYVSHLRNGDRIPKPGHAAAGNLAKAAYHFADEKKAVNELCDKIKISRGAGAKKICAAVEAWLFEAQPISNEKTRDTKKDQRTKRVDGDFGNRLEKAMELADISAVRLARMLNVDASLIIKYRSGLRVPRINHPIIHDISLSLGGQIYALGRTAGLSRLIDIPMEELYDEEYGVRHLESWLRDFGAADNSLISGFLDGMDAFHPDTKMPILSLEDAVSEEIIAETSDYYFGKEGLRRAVLRFLGNAVRNKEKELLLYSDQSIEWMVDDRDFSVRWMSLMSAYVKGGGKIKIIHNVERSLEDMVAALYSWMPLYFSGCIQSYYCLKHLGDRFSHTFFIAPESACICATCVKGKEKNARYTYITDKEERFFYSAFFKELLSECRPLLSVIYDDGISGLPAMMNDKSIHFMSQSISLGTMPEELLRKILGRAAISDELKRKITADWASQRELITQKLVSGEIHECFTLPDKKALSEEKVLVDTDRARLYYQPEEYALHLRSVIGLAEKNGSYVLYPFEEAPFERIKLAFSNRIAVILSPTGRVVGFTATHPLLCRAFVDFAKRLEDKCEINIGKLKNTYGL